MIRNRLRPLGQPRALFEPSEGIARGTPSVTHDPKLTCCHVCNQNRFPPNLFTAKGMQPRTPTPPPPPCDIPSGCCFFTGPWTVTRSSLRMLRRVAAFCRPLRPVLLLVSFPRSRSPVVGVPGAVPPRRPPAPRAPRRAAPAATVAVAVRRGPPARPQARPRGRGRGGGGWQPRGRWGPRRTDPCQPLGSSGDSHPPPPPMPDGQRQQAPPRKDGAGSYWATRWTQHVPTEFRWCGGAGITEWRLTRGRSLLSTSFPAGR